MTFSKFLAAGAAASAFALMPGFAQAQDQNQDNNTHRHTHASDHAPIGVMADHRHQKGEWMVSYRYMSMTMDGSRDGTSELSTEQIATQFSNPFSGTAGQPPTLRVVPTQMTMDMHMLGAMYGLTDNITLMAMTSYVEKDMDHTTFAGGAGTTVQGTFNVNTEGFGDSTVGAIIGLKGTASSAKQLSLITAFSLPTGSITQTSEILTPMNTRPTVRVPYAMQLGTGTFDFKPGLTYTSREKHLGWGGQVMARLPLADNDQDYRYGNRLDASAWLSYEPKPGISVSGRLSALTQGTIKGQDDNIVAPVQTADPDSYGGDQVFAHIGLNLLGQKGIVSGHRLAFEYGVPLYRDLNGPQLETDETFTLAWQKAF